MLMPAGVLFKGGAGLKGAMNIGKSAAQVAGLGAAEETLANMEGSQHAMIQADISDPEAVHDMVEKLLRDHGQIDILVKVTPRAGAQFYCWA